MYQSLFDSPGLAGLEELLVSNFRPGDALAAALAGSAAVRRLESVSLNGTRLTATGLERLVSAPWFGGVTWLNLRGNPLGDAGVRALVGSPYARNLQELDLGMCKIKLEGIRLLAD